MNTTTVLGSELCESGGFLRPEASLTMKSKRPIHCSGGDAILARRRYHNRDFEIRPHNASTVGWIVVGIQSYRLTLSSIIGTLTMHWSGAERTLFRRMIPVVQDRLRDVNNDCEKSVSHRNLSVEVPN